MRRHRTPPPSARVRLWHEMRIGAMVMKFLRKIARAIRWTPQRLLHPLRRRRALRILNRRRPPRTVLFVCHGNICRSPYAQQLLQKRLPARVGDRLRVVSAGFTGPNRASPPEARAQAGRCGLDLSPHRSQVLSAEVIGKSDLIFVMDVLQQRAICRRFGRSEKDVLILGDLDPRPIDRRTIRDPVEQPEEVFAASYERIERCIDVLLPPLVRSIEAQEHPRAGTMASVGQEA